MATWNELKDYIHGQYKATEISPRALELLFNLADGRSQLVWVTSQEGGDGDEWASIDSAIGPLHGIDLIEALKLVETSTCGGLSHLLVRGQELVALRHAFPLRNLDPNEFESPLNMVVLAADDFERRLTGTDVV